MTRASDRPSDPTQNRPSASDAATGATAATDSSESDVVEIVGIGGGGSASAAPGSNALAAALAPQNRPALPSGGMSTRSRSNSPSGAATASAKGNRPTRASSRGRGGSKASQRQGASRVGPAPALGPTQVTAPPAAATAPIAPATARPAARLNLTPALAAPVDASEGASRTSTMSRVVDSALAAVVEAGAPAPAPAFVPAPVGLPNFAAFSAGIVWPDYPLTKEQLVTYNVHLAVSGQSEADAYLLTVITAANVPAPAHATATSATYAEAASARHPSVLRESSRTFHTPLVQFDIATSKAMLRSYLQTVVRLPPDAAQMLVTDLQMTDASAYASPSDSDVDRTINSFERAGMTISTDSAIHLRNICAYCSMLDKLQRPVSWDAIS